MPTIRLSREWSYDEGRRLGPPGGFGEVFRGQGPSGDVAVKRLKLTAGAAAYREMRIGQNLANRHLSHVVPVLDYGQDTDTDGYYLVMPVCERSLQDNIQQNGPLTLPEVKAVALAILNGLAEVGDIVHRDLKPGNVLFYEGQWRLADFGIAKFVEDSTSLQTLRGSLTPAYGAPEQWRGERPSHATDVYALGCIMHALLNGSPPFLGSQDDVRRAHLAEPPPALGGDPRLSAFVNQMLRKAPEARPSIARCIEVIQSVDTARPKAQHAGLLAAAGKVSREMAEAEARAQAEVEAAKQRKALLADATHELRSILDRLIEEIKSHADNAQGSAHIIKLGNATLSFSDITSVTARAPMPNHYGQRQSIDIVGYATASVKRQSQPIEGETGQLHLDPYGRQFVQSSRDVGYEWGATLFYTELAKNTGYRWYEAGFWTLGGPHADRDSPFAMTGNDEEFRKAFSNVATATNLAYGPLPIDGENEDDFQERWLALFAKAVDGSLRRPNQIPLPRHYFASLSGNGSPY